MCLRCDGYSEEQIRRRRDLTIRVHGWLMAVVEDDDGPGWTYTVGLTESFGHPELLCVGVEADVQQTLVQSMADEIAESGHVNGQPGCQDRGLECPQKPESHGTSLHAPWRLGLHSG